MESWQRHSQTLTVCARGHEGIILTCWDVGYTLGNTVLIQGSRAEGGRATISNDAGRFNIVPFVLKHLVVPNVHSEIPPSY